MRRPRVGGGRALAVVAAAVALCAGCQTTVSVDVNAARDGSGVVRVGVGLDAEAASRIRDLGEGLPVSDLTKAGWVVQGPRKERDGRTWLRASKRFVDPADLRSTLSEVAGPDGAFSSIRLVRSSSTFSERVGLSGSVDLTRGVQGFSDAPLRKLIQAEGAGLDVGSIAQSLGASSPGSLTFSFSAELPGGARGSWSAPVGQKLAISLTSVNWRVRRVVGAAVAAGAALLLVVLLAFRLVAAFARRRRVRE